MIRQTALAATISLAGAAFTCAPPARAADVGNTSYTALPYVRQVYLPCWECSPDLDPAQLFFSANPNSPFLNPTIIAKAKSLAAAQSAAGIVPTAGLQRWEDTYEASFPAGTFPNEPAWIAADRKAGNYPKKPEFVAWRNFISSRPQYADVAYDGGTMPPQANYFRSWGGQWGYISPLTPLDQADCPPDKPDGCTWGDDFAYRYAQTNKLTGGYGLALSDFTDAQPYADTLHNFNARIIESFNKMLAPRSVQGNTVQAQAQWIIQNAFNAWTDFLSDGYARFYGALASSVGQAAGHPALIIGQCSISPAYRRTEGTDERIIAQLMSPENFMCIWDDQVIQLGRSGPLATPPMAELAGYVLAAAREPSIRNGANLEADDAAYWSAIASFYPNLPAATQTELGLKLLKRLWVWSGWAHIADRSGEVRRALAFVSRDYWDAGSVTRLAPIPALLRSIVPARPFGPALYYPASIERKVETEAAANLQPGSVPNTYLMPSELQALLDSGAPLGYYVSDAALPQISEAAGNVPSAWIVLNDGIKLPPAELASLQATAPVAQTVAEWTALQNQPLAFSAGVAGFGFWSAGGKLVVVASNPSTAPTAGSVAGTVQIAWSSSTRVIVRELQSGTRLVLPVSGGKASWPVNISRWDTLIFEITP